MTTQNDHPLTIPTIRRIKVRHGNAPLVMVTAYDAPTARIAASAGVDIILVGDSLGTAILGYDSTLPVTLADMLHHLKAARRGAPGAHIVVDLPFGSYQESDAQAIASAVTLMQQGGADAVKLEGGRRMANRVRALTDAGIPVVGHVGLTPQTAGMLGGYKVQGRDLETARAVLDDAQSIADAGAYCLVVEVVPSLIGQRITEQVDIPVIGIGAGPATDGQVLVWTDLAGLTAGHQPRFVHAYANLAGNLQDAFAQFASEVRSGAYPKPEHEYGTPPALVDALEAGT